VSSGWVLSSVAVFAAYLIGTFPSAMLVARRSGHDPTREGSNNPGASNVYRIAGRKAGALVLAVDLGKGIGATLVGWAVGGRTLALATGAAAVFGHVAPVTRRFQGGKGVATAGGMAVVLWPLVSVVLLALFLLLAVGVKIASVGSLAMAAGLPVGVAFSGGDVVEVGVATGVAALVIARHHENIGRLIRGEERRTAPTGANPSSSDRPNEPTT
jgi:acyl phosphate:glycerol-3-phosphate acyltransferase